MAAQETFNLSLGEANTEGKHRREKWQACAKSRGIRSLGEWVRVVCDEEANGGQSAFASNVRKNKRMDNKAKDLGYESAAELTREITEWVFENAVWEKGKGITGFKKV